FKNLAGTLPEDKRLIYTPLVNRGDGLSYAMAFAAVQRFYPAYLDSFIEASMVAAQDKGVSTATWLGLDRIGRATRLPVSLPKLVKDNETQVIRDVELFITLRHNLQVVNTPAHM
ncbi:MAG: thiol-disulfide isomerase, partial [Burkholderiales bacterium PBB4]